MNENVELHGVDATVSLGILLTTAGCTSRTTLVGWVVMADDRREAELAERWGQPAIE